MAKEIDDRATCYDCANGFNGKKKTSAACGHVYKKEPEPAPIYVLEKKQNRLIVEAAIKFVKAYNKNRIDKNNPDLNQYHWNQYFGYVNEEATALFEAVEKLEG